MSETLYEKHKLSSFDRNYSTEVYLKSPDKYRQLEKDSLKVDNLIKLLIKIGYERTSIVRDKSEFAVRGSIIDIFLPQFEKPIRWIKWSTNDLK